MVGPDLSLASPACIVCGGSGWDSRQDRECRCVTRAEAAAVDAGGGPDLLSDSAMMRLETSIRRELIDARRTSATHDAAAIVRAVARGALPPSVRALAVYAKVDEDVAARIFDRIRGAG